MKAIEALDNVYYAPLKRRHSCEPRNVLISQVGYEELLELQAGIAEMALDRAFGTSDFCGDGFDGKFVVVVKQKDASAGGGKGFR